MSSFSDIVRTHIVSFAFTALFALFRMILPIDAKGLLSEIVQKASTSPTPSDNDKLRENVLKLTKALPHRSMQRKVLESALATTYKCEILKKELGMGRKGAASARKNFRYIVDQKKEL